MGEKWQRSGKTSGKRKSSVSPDEHATVNDLLQRAFHTVEFTDSRAMLTGARGDVVLLAGD